MSTAQPLINERSRNANNRVRRSSNASLGQRRFGMRWLSISSGDNGSSIQVMLWRQSFRKIDGVRNVERRVTTGHEREVPPKTPAMIATFPSSGVFRSRPAKPSARLSLQSMCHCLGRRKGKPVRSSISIFIRGPIDWLQLALTGSLASAAMVFSMSSVSK